MSLSQKSLRRENLPMQNEKILVIDANSLCYQAMFTLGGLSYKEQSTGVIFGFLNRLLSLTKRFQTNCFVFCFDSKKSVRKSIYSEYKANRSNPNPEMAKMKEIMFPQITLLRKEILPQMGFKNIFMRPGYESDDIIARIVKTIQADFVVVSQDNDLNQLLDYCRIFDGKVIKNLKWLQENYGIMKSKEYAYALAIAGCTTDNVKGIYGVGMATAIKYVVKQGARMQEKLYLRIISKEGQEVIRRNLRLVTLPYPGFHLGAFALRFGKGSFAGFQDVCEKYSLRSFVTTNKFEEWKTLLN